MLDKYNEDTLGHEVEGRLHALFAEDDKKSMAESISIHPDNYPLIELKSIILSLDWEISDEIVADFLMHTANLIEHYSNDKVILTLLNILGALGKYIQANRSQSHPDSFQMLRSTFSTLDQVIQSKDISSAEKNELLKTQVKRYKELRQQIVDMKSSKLRDNKRSSLSLGETNHVGGEQSSHVQLDADHIIIIALRRELSELKSEIKQHFQSEFKILRQELKQSFNLGDT